MTMATETPLSPKPIVYHQPGADRPNHGRRMSTRRSFTTAPLPPSIESPRTLLPQDGENLNYEPVHLNRWLLDRPLFERLPKQLQLALNNVQTAGAAVLAGYERLEQHKDDVDIGTSADVPEDEMMVDSVSSLELPPMLHAESSASSSAILSWTSSGSPSPPLSGSGDDAAVSPISLTPADSFLSPTPATRSRERSFSIPLEPRNARYVNELSQLRTESLPRLRHRARMVNTEWYELKRDGALDPNDITAFEDWWSDKKSTICQLYEKGRFLASIAGIAPNGTGWSGA